MIGSSVLGLVEPTATSIFLGAALVAASVGITSEVLIELGVLSTRRARTILGRSRRGRHPGDGAARGRRRPCRGRQRRRDVGAVVILLALGQVDLGAFADGSTLALLAGVTVLAVATRFAGAWVGAYSLGPRDAAFVGVGMEPRGEVGIIVAGIGRTTGVTTTSCSR